MKTTTIILIFLLSIGLSAQDKESKPADDKEKTEEAAKSPNPQIEKDESKFEDKDGNGLNDIKQGKQKRKGRTDNFVDKDGDGINDNRAQGMGWSGGRKHKGFGKHKK